MRTNKYYIEQEKIYIMNTYNRYPITLIKGNGQFVWDVEENKYLDFLSGISCTLLGHNHPKVIKAIKEQVDFILHTSNLFYSPPNIELAKCLIENGGLDSLFFCNSGTEANECAIKLARKYQWSLGKEQKNVILSAHHSFHGRTLGALAATAKPKIQEGFSPLPLGFKYESWDDTEAFCKAIDDNVAAVILEPIQGEGGINQPPAGFLNKIRQICTERDVLLIFDEIQCGLGRTGFLFAYQYFNVTPDIITLAKGIASGLPLGVVCATQKVAKTFSPGDHGTTFGGNPVSCSAALATINIILNENILEKVKELGTYFKDKLCLLKKNYPKYILDIRATGLMIAIDFNFKNLLIVEYLQKQGILVHTCGENSVRLLPSFVINKKDIDIFIENVKEYLNDIKLRQIK